LGIIEIRLYKDYWLSNMVLKTVLSQIDRKPSPIAIGMGATKVGNVWGLMFGV
jgi:hypothetical protein